MINSNIFVLLFFHLRKIRFSTFCKNPCDFLAPIWCEKLANFFHFFSRTNFFVIINGNKNIFFTPKNENFFASFLAQKSHGQNFGSK